MSRLGSGQGKPQSCKGHVYGFLTDEYENDSESSEKVSDSQDHLVKNYHVRP